VCWLPPGGRTPGTAPERRKGGGGRPPPPPPGRENRQDLLSLLHALHSDPNAQGATQEFFDDLEKKNPGNLARDGRTIIRRIINSINYPDDQATGDLREWIRELLEQTRDHAPRKKATVSTHNLGPVGITLSMDVIEDTLTLNPYVTCFQDILLHGQDIRSIKRAIGEFSSDYHIFSDIGAHANDDIRRTNYAGWRSSGMVSLTMLHRGIFNIHQCTKYEWRTGKDRRSQLGRGRVLWIKATTITGKKVNIINVYQATSRNHEQQERLYDTLAKAVGPTTDPCILVGDVNASIPGGRTN